MKKLFILILILVPLSGFAASEYVLLEPLPCIENTGQGDCAQNGGMLETISTQTYLSYVYKFTIAFAAVLAVVLIIYAGFEYALTDIVTKKGESIDRIKNALWGLATLLASYLLLQTIDPRLVKIDTVLPEIELVGTTFDYADLVMTAADYKVREDLKLANGNAKALEKKVSELRALADAEPNEERSITLREQALTIERQANLIRDRAAGQAQYDLSKNILPSVGWNINAAVRDSLEARKASIRGTYDDNIALATRNGEIENLAVLEAEKKYYLAKFEQDIILQQAKALMKDTEAYTSSIITTNNPIARLFNGKPSEVFASSQKSAINHIETAPTPAGLTPEQLESLRIERKQVLDAIRAIPPPR